ncbi:Short-chain dehydrogenase [Nakamurella panacisegetis]|uniref:Short-chain dehydrogenase n=1 Tax=Nakamurella panacisegetis TaxID=1090615 RepID=A0A1H0L478_9ACTN|nr:SDR family NAD(P)-dependent oxidoreductase [Nakamurella panacisegetis]SDO63038.1 Short-chain dehydrogenase [Nakamurella panacisegetis]
MTKTVLITGTSSGIGAHTAVAAARSGWRAVATMRDVSRAGVLTELARSAGVLDLIDIRALDITDLDSVTSCLDGVIADFGALDAVVNNAGAGHVGTLELERIDDVRTVMEVNFFGTVLVTKAALPHLRASGGRVLTVTSVGGVVGQPFNEAYCAAKFAVEGFMESLAPVAATVGVTVVVIEPGAVASGFVGNVGLDATGLMASAGPYAPALTAYLARTAGAFAHAQSAADAAGVIISALTAEDVPFRMQTSPGARAFAGVKLADLDGSGVIGLTTTWVAS